MARLHERDLRGASKTGWLDSRHTFSFGGFYDPARMGFSALRVVNEDHVIPGAGFPTHGHQDMEILTFVVSGALAHKDSLGNSGVIKPGDVQLMSAGAGITHSEMNASEDEPVHFFQIWIEPNAKGHAADYQQISLPDDFGADGFDPIVAPTGGSDRVSIRQDATVSLARPTDGARLDVGVNAGRRGFLQIVKGRILLDGEELRAGDAIEFQSADRFEAKAIGDAELLLFDLP